MEQNPDVTLLRSRAGRCRKEKPTSADALLLFEAADSTLRHDTGIQLPL